MTIKNPYTPPNYGMVNVAIDRRVAAQDEPVIELGKPAKAKPAKKKED